MGFGVWAAAMEVALLALVVLILVIIGFVVVQRRRRAGTVLAVHEDGDP
ncbi:hypothetical protein BH20ACT2_BH20ACT2_15190 [soil metagenome]